LFLANLVNGQDQLTKEEAIARFLSNNYDVRLAEQNVELAATSASKAAVGYYPLVNLSGNVDFDLGGAQQTFQDGREISADNNLTQVYAGGLGINYNIYQGGQRKHSLKRLLQVVELNDIQKRQVIENGIVQLMNIYHQAALLQQQVDIQNRQTEISKKQRDRALIDLEYGSNSRADVLTAETLLKRDSATLISLQANLSMSKRQLLEVLGESALSSDFVLDTEVAFNVLPKKENAGDLAAERNVQMDILGQNARLLDHDEKIIRSARKPVLGVSADYQYRFQDFGEGAFFAQQRSNALGGGLNLSWNVFDGGVSKNQLQVLEVQRDLQSTQTEQARTTLRNQAYNLFEQLLAAKQLIGVEESNVEVSQANLERTTETYEFGRSNTLILREAQLSLLRAESALESARFAAKDLEIQLLQLTGMLLNDDIIL
jgi:outer membrane protein TolC